MDRERIGRGMGGEWRKKRTGVQYYSHVCVFIFYENCNIMKIHIVQHDILTLKPEDNMEWIAAELEAESSREALLTVFPACTICGAPLFAAAAYTDLQKRAQAALQRLIELSEHRAFLVGMPLQIQDKGLCNAIVFVQNCAIRGVVTKKYLTVDEQKDLVMQRLGGCEGEKGCCKGEGEGHECQHEAK